MILYIRFHYYFASSIFGNVPRMTFILQVSWVDHHFISLSLEDRRVVDDHRFSIVRPYIKEWNLQIRDVSWQDQGQYRCTVNTDPPKSKMVMLHVKGKIAFLPLCSSTPHLRDVWSNLYWGFPFTHEMFKKIYMEIQHYIFSIFNVHHILHKLIDLESEQVTKCYDAFY